MQGHESEDSPVNTGYVFSIHRRCKVSREKNLTGFRFCPVDKSKCERTRMLKIPVTLIVIVIIGYDFLAKYGRKYMWTSEVASKE